MQSEPGPKTLPQALQVISWLEEERRRDKAELLKFQQTLEQLSGRFRDLVGRLDVAEGDLRQVKSQASQGARTDEALRQLREVQAALQQRQEEHERASGRSGQAHAVELERDRRVVADMLGQITEALRELEAAKSRHLLLVEEVRRDKSNVPTLQQEVVQLGRRAQGLADQISLIEDGLRHRDARLADLSRQAERLGGEQSRFTDWQRLTEVRSGRQFADWQQQMDDWRHQAEEVAVQMESSSKLLPVLKDELAETRRAFGETREGLTAQSNKLADLAAQRTVDRESAATLEEAQAKLSARADDLIGYYHNLTDRIDRALEQVQAVDSRLRVEKERGESILRVIARLESQDDALGRRSEEIALELAGTKRAGETRTEQVERDLQEQGRRLAARLQELERLDAEHKQREIVELEQQIREMQERTKQVKS
jgi:chromosome segregation ATPase